jgi:hypothetical protein
MRPNPECYLDQDEYVKDLEDYVDKIERENLIFQQNLLYIYNYIDNSIHINNTNTLNTLKGRDKGGGVGEEKEKGTSKYSNKNIRRNSKHSQEEMMAMFEGFWNFYDKKVGKDKAILAWFKLSDEEIEKIRNTLPAYLEAHRERKFRKDPVRYLTHKAFNDELPTQSGGHSQHKPYHSTQNDEQPLRFYTPPSGIVR